MSRNKVAVYGTLRAGFGNHRLLQDSEYVGPVSIKGVMYDLGAYPAVSLKGDNLISCEVYEVDDTTLGKLDWLEGHPDFYERRRVHTHKFGDVFMYIIDDLEGYKEIPSGDWIAHKWRMD